MMCFGGALEETRVDTEDDSQVGVATSTPAEEVGTAAEKEGHMAVDHNLPGEVLAYPILGTCGACTGHKPETTSIWSVRHVYM